MTARVVDAVQEVAYRMFVRNVADYGDPALIELAWLDPDIQQFWLEQAEAVVNDLRDIGADRTVACCERPTN